MLELPVEMELSLHPGASDDEERQINDLVFNESVARVKAIICTFFEIVSQLCETLVGEIPCAN